MNEVVTFLRSKDFRYIKNIGQGGTGKTVLLEDETINETFVCKKYSPFYDGDTDRYYANFIDEIKILHTLYNNNIVRVFNYYLYPEKKTGYILMEYVKGQTIAEFISKNPDRIDDVFIQMTNGFKYLEENSILHRDIRPENILVTEDGIVKIIDFGFGKRIVFDSINEKSISLNWRYTTPSDFIDEIYDQTTEVYFVGKLIEEIIEENGIENFGYSGVLKGMIANKRESRIPDFISISREVLNRERNLLEFDEYDRIRYKNFAEDLDKAIAKIRQDANYITDPDKIIKNLEDVFQVSTLEDYIQNPNKIVASFVKGDYYYNGSAKCLVLNLKYFIELLRKNSVDRRKVIINNLCERMDKKTRYANVKEDDDLPF